MGRCCVVAVALLVGCGSPDQSDGTGEYPAEAGICIRSAWLQNACWAVTDCETSDDPATCYVRQEHPVQPENPCGAEAPVGSPAHLNSAAPVIVLRAETCRDAGDPRWYCGKCPEARCRNCPKPL